MRRVLVGPDEPFTGAGVLDSRPGGDHERQHRPFVRVSVGGYEFSAILDTGGHWLVLSPDDASLVGSHLSSGLGPAALKVRGVSYTGTLARAPVLLVAVDGTGIEVELTALILEDASDWSLPSFLGWHGCLERFRFALDAEAERFYFGVLGAG